MPPDARVPLPSVAVSPVPIAHPAPFPTAAPGPTPATPAWMEQYRTLLITGPMSAAMFLSILMIGWAPQHIYYTHTKWSVAFVSILLSIVLPCVYIARKSIYVWSQGILCAPIMVLLAYAGMSELSNPQHRNSHLSATTLLAITITASYLFSCTISALSGPETPPTAARAHFLVRVWILCITMLGILSIFILMGGPPQNAPISALDLIRYTQGFKALWFVQIDLYLIGAIWLFYTQAESGYPRNFYHIGITEIARWIPILAACWSGSAACWFGQYLNGPLWNPVVNILFGMEIMGCLWLFVSICIPFENASETTVSDAEDPMDTHVFEMTPHTTDSVLMVLGQSLAESTTTVGPASTQVRTKMAAQVTAMQNYLLHTPPQPYDRADMVSHISQIRDLPHVAGVWETETSLIVALHALTMDSPTTGQVHLVGGVLIQIAPTLPYIAVQPVLGLRHPYLLNTVADLSSIQATLAEHYADHDLVGIVLTLCNYLQSPDPTFPGLGASLAQYPLAPILHSVPAHTDFS